MRAEEDVVYPEINSLLEWPLETRMERLGGLL